MEHQTCVFHSAALMTGDTTYDDILSHELFHETASWKALRLPAETRQRFSHEQHMAQEQAIGEASPGGHRRGRPIPSHGLVGLLA